MNYQTPPSNQLLHPPCLSNLNWEQHLDAFMANTLNSHSSHFMPFPTDAGFVQRAARYSSFSYSNYGAFSEISESEKPTRAASSHCLKVKESGGAQLEVGDAEFGSGREDSSVTDPASAYEETNAKKRKAAPKRKQKAAEESDFSAKKSRSTEAVGTEKGCAAPKEEQSADEKIGKDDVAKAAEPFKDYIHVRARRGQATDSHSLAERVRREKISQRMKLLQDLVPGCNKITGKALMLDEIINYVQSLQRQVEFLSMKLATVNPGLDFNLESLISKESLLNQANASFPNSFYPSENTSASINYVHQSNKEINPLPFTVANGMGSIGQLDSILHQASMMQSSLDMFGISASQVENLWDEELHNALQTGFHGQLSLGHMKMEP